MCRGPSPAGLRTRWTLREACAFSHTVTSSACSCAKCRLSVHFSRLAVTLSTRTPRLRLARLPSRVVYIRKRERVNATKRVHTRTTCPVRSRGFASSRPGCGIKSAPSRTNRGFASLSKYLYHNECARLSARGCCQRPLSMYPPPNHLAPLRGTSHLLAHPADADACVVKESILLGDRLGPHRQSLLNWLHGRGCRRGGLVRHRRVVPAWSAAG